MRKIYLKNLHREFVRLGRERNRITYKLLSLLPKINKLRIYEGEGYANIYDYAAKIAGLSSGVVQKALKLDEKLRNLPHLQKAIQSQGINKVGILVGLATKENEKDLAEKIENMSKPALQEYSKDLRGKTTISWQIEMDEQMMFMFLKLKKRFGKNLSNKECLRKILEITGGNLGGKTIGKTKAQNQAEKPAKIPGEKLLAEKPAKILGEKTLDFDEPPKDKQGFKISRYIPVQKKRNLSVHCSHPNCFRPAEIVHHPDRFSLNSNHENLKPLCKLHHEFAHNGISEPMSEVDYQYRKLRQEALL